MKHCVLLVSFVGALVLALPLDGRAPSVIDWTQRLEQLDPARPVEYLELAEEIADQADDQQSLAQAKHLFALAGALDSARLGQSAALALADMQQDRTAKRRLLALASLLDPFASASTTTSADRRLSNETLESISKAFSLYRLGRGPQAIAELNDFEANSILQQHSRLLPGGYNQFLQDCRIYKAGLSPTLSDAELVRMLRFEKALLSGAERNWSGDLLLGSGEPLIEVNPQRVDETLGVDVSRSVYRNGEWVSPADS